VLAFTENPFVGDIEVTSDYASTIKFEVEKALFADQLIDLQHNNILKERHREENIVAFWFNLCSKEIVRGISYVCSENLDLLRIYICV